MLKQVGIIQDKVTSQGITSASTTEVKLEKGFMNGINLSLQSGVGDSTITVKYNPVSGKPIYQLQNFPLKYLQNISDQRGGHSLVTTRMIQNLILGLDEIVSEDGTAIENTVHAESKAFAQRTYKTSIDIALGALHLDPASVEIEINWKYNDTPASRTVHISRYENDRRPMDLLVYGTSKESSKTFEDVRELYAVATANYSPSKDAFFQVSDQFTNQDDSFEGFHQTTLVNGRYESAPVGEVPVKIYGSVFPLPQNVEVEITGSEASEIELITVQEEVIASEVANNTKAEAQRLAMAMSKLEGTRPEKAQAYRDKLGLPTAERLLQAVSRAR